MTNKKILVVSAHPDDETLGCGGTLLKKRAEGMELFWLILTNMSKHGGYTSKEIKRRQAEIEKVSELYGFRQIYKLDFTTGQLDHYPLQEIIVKVSEIIGKVRPAIIYLPNRRDSHSDHRVTFDCVLACTKSFRSPFISTIMMYETLSETEFAPALVENAFVPNAFCDITPYMEKKIKIMRIYKNELLEHPFPRSEKNIKALATFRGATINVEYAEAFMLLKDVF
jgi:LmbE family N-acetylglucosaminyl deacetylase